MDLFLGIILTIIMGAVALLGLAILFAIVCTAGFFAWLALGYVAGMLKTKLIYVMIFFGVFVIAVAVIGYGLASAVTSLFGW